MGSHELFLKEKPVRIILNIRRSRKEVYASKIAKDVDTTYAHAVKTLHRMEEKGLLTSDKKGRKKLLGLTDKGEKHAEMLEEIHDMFYDGNEEKEDISSIAT